MELNKKQKVILYVVIAVIVAMFLFPPTKYNAEYGEVINWGYRFIFDQGRGTTNVAMLITQWIGVLIIGGLAFFAVKDKKD